VYSGRVPNGVSAAKGSVALTLNIPGVGRVVGKKTFDELASGPVATDKKNDKPAVVSTPVVAKP
jgi:hypothetical protein